MKREEKECMQMEEFCQAYAKTWREMEEKAYVPLEER